MSNSPKILVADDSPLVSRLLSNILRGAGYTVVTAADGLEAAQMTFQERPDLVLLDIFMPRMNGYQVCRLLKHDAAVSHIPVIINTAAEGRSAEFWSRHTGADDFLLKGVAPAEMLAKIAHHLASSVVRARSIPPVSPTAVSAQNAVPGTEDILSKVSALVDAELYATTIQAMQLKTIQDNLCEGILVSDTRGAVSSINFYLCGLLGIESQSAIGQTPVECLGEGAGKVVAQMIEQALRGEPTSACDSEVFNANGVETPVAVTVAPVRDYLGEIVGCVCLLQDITRRKQVERLNQLKNDLTDMIVHDLRTPLTSVLTGLQTVEMLGDLNEDQEELLGISIDGSQVLLGMINDLLDISKMEDGSLQLERKAVELATLLDRAVRQVAALAKAKGVKLNCVTESDLAELHADEDKLLRTMVNLLSNAIKFTPQGGQITLSAHFVARPERRDSVVFVCRDSGEGIPADAFGRIFEKFGQVENRKSGRKMSTGLGLTFCKMVAEAHSGRIWVESETGQGSVFALAIPTT